MTAAKGFKAAGMYAGLRAAGTKPDLAVVLADRDATVAGEGGDTERKQLRLAGRLPGIALSWGSNALQVNGASAFVADAVEGWMFG